MADLILPDSCKQPEIPEHLIEGHKAFTEWKEAMARAGEPLPPGGVFIMNRSTILKGCLIRFRVSVAAELKMPLECIVVDVQTNELGALIPHIDVNPPEDWLAQEYAKGQGATARMEEFARMYISGVLERYYDTFKSDAAERLEALQGPGRPDLDQTEVEDLLDSEETEATGGSAGETVTPG